MSSDDDFQYGLPDLRDREGNLKSVEHTFEYDGEEITIEILPPTIAELEHYREDGEIVSDEKLADMIAAHVIKPEIDDPNDLTQREINAYQQGIIDYQSGSGFVRAVNEALEDRVGDGAEGN